MPDPRPPYLSLRSVSKGFGRTSAVVDLNLDVAKGALVCLLGPSGCGKTTTLRLIAGFETQDSGSIQIDGRDIGRQRPYARNVGLLFQDYALFPHMTVVQNVAYGLKRRNYSPSKTRQQCDAMLDLVKLRSLSQRMPHELSGGERQRVALARSLAVGPDIILLDEPLSALDAKLRQELRVDLKEILRHIGITTLIVTHDQEEAMGMAEEIAIMRKGRIVQRGTPDDIYLRPTSQFVARFIGRSNWFTGRVQSQHQSGVIDVLTDDGIHLRVAADLRVADECELYVRPERVQIRTSTSGGDCISGTIVEVAPLGSEIHYWVAGPKGKRIAVIEQNTGHSLLRVGQSVSLSVPPEDLVVLRPDAADD